VAEGFGLRLTGPSARRELEEILKPVATLLVIDNCEPVVEACAELADALLRSCPDLQILATSREVLNVPGEIVWPVHGLAVPELDADALGLPLVTDAVRLFQQRAQAVSPTFALTPTNTKAVAEICRRLDGIPLAIELAAARSKVLGPEPLARRLGDPFHVLIGGNRTAPRRQQTLRATVDWSYDLLPEAERELFGRMSVFSGGCTLEAVLAVSAHEHIGPDEAIHVIERLVDRSLIVAQPTPDGSMRYRSLETLRQYGLEKLSTHGQLAPVRARHAVYFAGVVDAAEKVFVSPRQPEAEKILANEYENIRAALDWLIESGRLGAARRMVGGMWYYWEYRRTVSDGHAWVEQLLDSTPVQEAAARIKLLHAGGMIASWTHDLDVGEKYAEESLRLARELGDLTSVSCSLHQLGSMAHTRNANADAEALLSQGAETGSAAESAGAAAERIYPRGYARYFHFRNQITLGRVGYQTANFPLGDTAYEHARLLAAEADWPISQALALRGLALGKLRRGDLAGARSLLERSYDLFSLLEGNPEGSWTLMALGCIATDQRDLSDAATMLSEALPKAFSGAGGLRMTESNLDACAALAAASHRPVLAARLAGAAAEIHDRLPAVGYQQPIILPLRRERWLHSARAALGETAWAAHMAAGRAIPPAAAVAEALNFLQPTHQTEVNPLTQRELEVARLIARGHSNRQVADDLVIAVSTAERHVANILAKLDLASRTQLAAWVHEHRPL
jgi:predicted ATPase/DNA-binding CsgD family transcriptional regulator